MTSFDDANAMTAYDDQALLFITSTDARIPQGRNARAQHRTRTASKAAPAQGTFATLDLSTAGQDADGPHAARKWQNLKRSKQRPPQSRELTKARRPKQQQQHHHHHHHDMFLPVPTRPMGSDWALPFINPADILSVATFHVRRMAVMSMDTDSGGLTNILRCRQWSCIPFAFTCFGKDGCVDSAILCVADRIRFLSGCPFSPVLMMKHYERALRDLQQALYEPDQHNPQDVLAAVQLLAVYEMLDSLDNEGWAKHVAGAAIMIQKYTVITPRAYAKCESRGCGHALPMVGDALMKGDASFFRTYPWRELLWAIFEQFPDPSDGIQDLMQCLRLMPSLLLDVDAALGCDDVDEASRFGLLDRAHDIQHRMRNALRGNQLYSQRSYRLMFSTFDLLGTFLAGLVALDRMIALLRPLQLREHEPELNPTGELCAQLFQLELGASAAYPPPEVLAGFQHAGVLNVALGTRLPLRG